MAAIRAARDARRVCLIDKGMFGRSGCTPMGAYSMCAALGYSDPRDNAQVHLEDTIRQGRFINNQEQVEVFTKEAPERVLELVSYGAKFNMEGGRLKQAMMAGHSYPRACFYERRTGQMIMRTLAHQVKKTPNIHIFEEVIVVDLVVTPGGVHYAIGLNWANSEFIVFSARSIVITTGGCGQLYKHTSTSLDNTGDGISLMFEAGAELSDMEFVQFFPTIVCYPKFPGLGPTATSHVYVHTDAKLYNSLGEEFVGREMPGWKHQATRDILSLAIYREIMEGRGSPHGGVFLDATHIPREKIREGIAVGGYFDKFLKLGVDLSKQAIETTVTAHFFMGGARVNTQGETTIPGLFAGGEAVAGYHGANRLAGNALSEILVSGARAGRFAAVWAGGQSRQHSDTQLVKERLQSLQKRVFQWRDNAAGLKPITGKQRLKVLMWEKAGLIRDRQEMEKGLDALRELEGEADRGLTVSPEARFNRELLDAFEFDNMMRVSSLILQAALVREESRGAHYRKDYPYPDDEKWLVNIILRKDRDRVDIKYRDVQFTRLNREGKVDHEP